MGQRPDMGLFPDISTLRQYIINSKKQMTATFEPIPGVVEKDHQVPTRDGSTITARVYSPEGKTGGPLVVIYHGKASVMCITSMLIVEGGGFCIGGLENEELLCRRAAGVLGCVIVNVDYRLAPEHKFPIPVNDCHDATKWVRLSSNAVDSG